ncbi:MAG: autotransporter domain-containing protein [Syntrophaceae bacterium]|nr:autotransporter domain-containing protein [Syntrophaceae bacterium]
MSVIHLRERVGRNVFSLRPGSRPGVQILCAVLIVLAGTVMTAQAATKLVPDTNYSDIIMNIYDDSYADDDPYTNQGIINVYSTLDNYGTFRNEPDALLRNYGTLRSDTGATLHNRSGSRLFNESGGTLINRTGGTLNNSGEFVNTGTATNSGALVNSGDLTNKLHGTLNNNSGATLTNDATGTLTNLGTINNSGTLTNLGVFGGSGTIVNDGGTIDNSGTSMSITTLVVNTGKTGIVTGSTPTTVSTGNVSGTLNHTGSGGLSFTILNLDGGVFNNNGSGGTNIGTAAVADGYTGTIGGTGPIGLTAANVDGTLNVTAVLSGTDSLTKTGTGTLTLSGDNTYTGGTNINDGTISVGSDGNLGDASGALTFGGGTLKVTNSFTTNRSVALDSSGGTFDTNGNSLTLSGVASGTGSLHKSGDGTLTLTSANTYTGGTTVSTGTLALSGAGTLGDATGSTTVSGGTLDLGTTTQTQAELRQSGGTVQNGTMNVTTYQMTGGTLSSDATVCAASGFDMQAGTVNGVLSGTGSLTKTGPGELTLSGTNTYTGGTNVNGGTVSVGRDDNLGDATGGLAFDGGTLKATGSFSTGRSVMLGSGGGTIDTNGNDLTINGDISGTGSLTKEDGGKLILTGTNTYTGGTSINGGTVSVSRDENLGDASGALTFGGGTLEVTSGFTMNRSVALNSGGGTIDTNGSDLTICGDISGTGSLTKEDGGKLILTGTNTYTGGTTVNGGILQGDTASLQGDITNNSQVTFDQESTGTYAGNMSGTGSLVKEGDGILVLTGINTYAGGTFVDHGALAVEGSITGDLAIGASGTLMGNGTITGNTVNSGTLAPGNSIGTLTIAGDYTHNAGAVYAVEVNAAGESDRLVVTGTATLNGGTVSVLAGSGQYFMNTTYTILSAGSVVGTFDSVTSNLAFLTPSLSYDAANVYLLLTRNSTRFADVALTPNQYAVASALDRGTPAAAGDMVTVYNNLLGLSAAGARSAYNHTGGLSHISLAEATFFSFNRYVSALAGRMEGFGAGGSSLAGSGNVLLAFREDAGSDAGNTLLAAIKSANSGNTNSGDFSPWGLWAKGYGNLGERRGDDISTRYDYRGGGLVVGFDGKVSEKLLLGASAGYSYTKVNMKNLNDDIRVAGYQGSLYGAYDVDPWYVHGLVAYGFNRYDTTRNIIFGTIARTAHAGYGGHSLSGYGEAGYRFRIGTVSVIPTASLQAGSLWRNAFTETDAGALGLAADSDRMSSLIGSLGVGLKKEFRMENGSITPEIRVRWLHEFVDGDYTLDASFTDDPVSTFSVRGDRVQQDSAVIGFGLSWEIGKSFDLALSYDATLSGDSTEHSGTAGIRYEW